ncbi:glycoside hydrolase family 1 protein [Belnapia rosea]|uniref:Beta-glucosidase/6-phospho-beta-glucosidase/beta-galactosidase n=1 Tax=Belnapia rosea TaxID=938405 RepID=A0A1G7DZZ2_9PROT|nr:beta-glucosidase [Belnapia rosea]SDE56961.1 Beta-glucosidase/6-phospho-beta-glucosidase/beta-galactosidase [Belnapia rosea]
MLASCTTRRRLLTLAATTVAPPAHALAPAATAPHQDSPVLRPSLFRSFFLGGFECSTHRRADGRRLDLIAATRHDVLVEQDYRQLARHGIRAVRDGVRWHLVEPGAPGHYNWSSLLPMLRAGEAAGTQVAWDLCHYGWPDELDVFSADFVERLARYAAAFARLHLDETGRPPVICPVNEISYLAWAGGDMARMNPLARGRGYELKRQLARAAIASASAVRAVAPGARILAIDPLIHIAPAPGKDAGPALAHLEAQFQAWDMLVGRHAPELGGAPTMLDLVGVNYYWNNQWSCEHPRLLKGHWLCEGEPLSPFDPRARPLRGLLAGVHARYGRPVFVAETSIEGERRADWLRHVGAEVREAIRAGIPVEGICLYPVLSHPGWDDDRYCPNGLLEMEVRAGRRVEHAPLAAELRRQQHLCETLFSGRGKE